MRRPKINQRIIDKLEYALGAATLQSCGVEAVHKEAMRLYLQTWVEGPLRAALREIKGPSDEA